MSREPIKLSNIKWSMPVVHKLVYELRYHSGYTYLDRCGRILTLIERDYPEWIVEGVQVNPQGAPLVNLTTGAEFRFSSANLSLTWEQAQADDELTQEGLEKFMTDGELLTQLVTNELGVNTEQLARIGFRVWYLFPADSREKAEGWLRALNCWNVSERLMQTFAGVVESSSLSMVLKCDDRCYRLSFSSGERHTQLTTGARDLAFMPRQLPKGQQDALARMQEQQESRKRLRQTSHFVAIVDIDAYQEEPLVLAVSDFLKSSWDNGYNTLRKSIS